MTVIAKDPPFATLVTVNSEAEVVADVAKVWRRMSRPLATHSEVDPFAATLARRWILADPNRRRHSFAVESFPEGKRPTTIDFSIL